MGMQIFETSGSFSPSGHGLASGDFVDVICVSGGCSGVCQLPDNTFPSVPGGESSFGSLVSSANGVKMGIGDPGKRWGSDSSGENKTNGCGAGGYLPGVSLYGGDGDGYNGLCGTRQESGFSSTVNHSTRGNKGATSGLGNGPSGHGYGAGAGGFSQGTLAMAGGDSGKIIFKSVALQSSNDVAVNVGSGGVNAGDNTNHGADGIVIVFW